MCHLHFSYSLINIKHLMRMYSEAAKLRVKVFPKIVCADIETAIYNAVTTAWPGTSFPFRPELVAENTIFGTQQAVWKERL